MHKRISIHDFIHFIMIPAYHSGNMYEGSSASAANTRVGCGGYERSCVWWMEPNLRQKSQLCSKDDRTISRVLHRMTVQFFPPVLACQRSPFYPPFDHTLDPTLAKISSSKNGLFPNQASKHSQRRARSAIQHTDITPTLHSISATLRHKHTPTPTHAHLQSTRHFPYPAMSTKRNQAQAISSPSSSTGNGEGHSNGNDDHIDKKFKQVHGDGDEDDDDDEDEEAPKSGKRAGRRKIKIEYIEDKSRRHITFSKRKSGIMKKAFELSTLTGTQVLLLVVSETGLVYTFTTPKLQPLVTKAEGKNLIQACLHAPDKEPTPDPNASGDQESREPTPVAEYEERQATTPQGSSQIQASNSSHASPQQQQQQHYQQQQQQAPPPLQGPPSGGYGSSSAMSVPTYPPPYNNIPFPAQYNYPNMGMHYQNAQNGPPGYGGGNQYWSGPPTQQQSDQDQQVKGGRKDK